MRFTRVNTRVNVLRIGRIIIKLVIDNYFVGFVVVAVAIVVVVVVLIAVFKNKKKI